jgi:hypothetical protein
MLVSNFSLGFTDYYQFETGWTAGYVLQITNLASQEIEFDVECRITHHYFGGTGPGDSVASSLGSMLGGAWHSDANGYYQQQSLTIGANRSEQYHLQPWIYQGRKWTPYVDGYVVLRVPVVRARQAPYALVPQAKVPIPVLLSASRVDQWIKRGSPPPALVTSSQSSFPLASGKALNEITPETQPYRHPIKLREYLGALVADGKLLPARGVLGLPEEDRAQALLDLLGQLDDDAAEIAALNQILEDGASPVRVVRPDRRSPG